MTRLLPWRLGVRGVTRNRRTSLLLALLIAAAIAAPFAVGTVASTAAFTSAEVATIAMGRADVQVRTTTYEQGRDTEAAPQAGLAGITQVLQDADLDLVLGGPTGPVGVQGRWLSYRDPLAAGIVVLRDSLGADAQLALSHAAMTVLGVELGDRVSVPRVNTDLVVTDEIAFAPGADAAWAIIDPSALSSEEAQALLADAGSIRWLIESDDLDATLTYLDEIDLIASTRAAVPVDETEPFVDPVLAATVVSVLAVLVLAGGGTALAGFHRRQGIALGRLGADLRTARRVIVVESIVLVAAGATLALPLGLAAAVMGRWWGEREVGQLWGPLEVSWPLYVGACGIILVLAPVLAIASSSSPRQRMSRSKRPSPDRDRGRVTTSLLGARLARQTRRGTAAGPVGVSAVIAVGAAAILILSFAARGYAEGYAPPVPEDMVWLGMPRQLTDDEARTLAAATGTAVTEDRRPMYYSPSSQGVVPVVVDSPMTRCTSDPGNDFRYCLDTVPDYREDTVAVIEPGQAAGFLGRALTLEETTAITTGDGLLLAPPEEVTRLVPYGSVQANATANGSDGLEHALIIEPVPVPGYDYDELPGLLVSTATLERWDLEIDPEPISYYLLTAIDTRPTEQTVRAALPPDLAVDADVHYDERAASIADFAATERVITGMASSLVFLIVTLLVLTWAADATSTLNRLARLGASRGALVRLLLVRGVRAIAPAVVFGTALTPALVWAFSEYALVTIPISGWYWLAPAVAAAVALPVAVIVRVRLAPEVSLST